MKKSLSLVVSSALVFSLFSSVAFAADATTTSTAPTTQEMMKDLGFSGTDHDYLDRASAAVSILKGLGIEVDNTATLSFTDVNASDAWAPYIATAAKLGIVHGVDATHFQPFEKVSQQDYAIMLTLGYAAKTGQKVDTTATTDVNAADYAKPYIKAAIDLGLLDASTDWSATAGYDWMVKGAYNAKTAIATPQAPAKVSVASAKATGVQNVEVTLDKAVDTSKASLSLKKGSVSVGTTTKWADDGKSATLTLTDTKLSAGDYSVTLAGLDASAIDNASASFTAQDETVQKIEFVSANDHLADTTNVSVLMKATNQYGENASFSAGSYTVIAGNNNDVNPRLSKTSDGTLKLTLDPSSLTSKQENISVIPVNVWFNDNHVAASKNFTLGVAPFVSKVELGDVSYSNGTAIAKSGQTATFDMNLYDQYGDLIGTNSSAYNSSNVSVIFNPYETNLNFTVGNWDTDNPNTPQVRVSLNKDVEKSGTYVAQVYYQGASATANIEVKSTAVATKVQLGDVGTTIAQGDADVYIPVTAYDADGNVLSTEDLISDTNVSRIHVSVSGADYDPTILNSGDHKGTIHLKNISAAPKSVVSVTAYIATANANSTSSKTYTVGDVRVPDHLKVANDPAKYYVLDTVGTLQTSSKLTVQVIDQYGGSLDNAYVVDSQGNLASTVTGNVYYYVKQTETGNNANFYLAEDGSKSTPIAASQNYGTDLTPATISSLNVQKQNTMKFDDLNNDKDFVAQNGATGPVTVKYELVKVTNAGTGSESQTTISTVTRTANVASSSDDLTYSVGSVDTLFNAIDSGVIPATGLVYGVGGTLSNSDALGADTSKFGREISVSAKNAAGDTVAIPHNIVAVTSSNPNVARVKLGGTNQAYVIGNKAGTATVGLSYRTANGSIKTGSVDVTVKSDALQVTKVVAGNTGVQDITSGANAWDTMDLKVTDNYNNTYEKQDAYHYNPLLGVSFSVTNVKLTNSALTVAADNTVTVTANGAITIGSNVASFDLTAVSANGMTATTPCK